jgi:hypothetical protein
VIARENNYREEKGGKWEGGASCANERKRVGYTDGIQVIEERRR